MFESYENRTQTIASSLHLAHNICQKLNSRDNSQLQFLMLKSYILDLTKFF